MKSLFLDEVLIKHDPKAVVTLFEGTVEAYRKGVAQRAIDWFRVSQHAVRMKANPWLGNTMFGDFASDREKKNFQEIKKLQQELPRQANDASAFEAAKVAVLASCGLTEIRKLGSSGIPDAMYCRPVLENRNPKWLSKWMELACRQKPVTHWSMVRQMELDGLGTATRESGYWTAMAIGLPQSEASSVELLKADAEMLTHHIWGLLDDEPAVSVISNPFETTNWREALRADDDFEYQRLLSSKRLTASKSWHSTLKEIGRDELVDKERFKERILYWIARIGSDDQMKDAPSFMKLPSRMEFFISIFESMQLSDEEKLELMPKIVGLLTSKDPDALKWAVMKLATYPPALINIDDLVVNLGSLLRIKGREHAFEAIKFVKALSDARPDDKVRLACVLVSGLEHPSQEVQKRVLDFIEKQKLIEEPDVVAELRYRSDALTGLLKERAGKLIPKSAGTSAPQKAAATNAKAPKLRVVRDQESTDNDGTAGDEADEDRSSDGLHKSSESPFSQEEIDSLKVTAASFADQIREVCGLDQAIQALEGSVTFAPALRLNAYDVPRLDPEKAMVPISDIDDLAYRLLHIMESGSDWEEIEQCIDGINRLCIESPADLTERLAPLRKRAIDKLSDSNRDFVSSTPFSGFNMVGDVAALCIAWTDKWVIEPQTGFNNPLVGLANFVSGRQWMVQYKAPWGTWQTLARPDASRPMAFVSKRFLAIAHRVAKRKMLPILAMPTHKGGWIDPTALVARLRVWDQAKLAPDPYDFIQALLRLAPEKRKEALDSASGGGDVAADAPLRGELADALKFALGGNMSSTMSKPELWVAAARARSPGENFDVLQHRFPGLGPDAAVRVQYDQSAKPLKLLENPYAYPPRPRARIFAYTSDVKTRNNNQLFPTELIHSSAEQWVGPDPCTLGLWLQDRESYLALHARTQAENIDSQSAFWREMWELLFDPDLATCGMARWSIAIGLSSKEPDNARTALDALISAIDDCRLDGIVFGDILAELLPIGRITVVRWVRAFADCARVSPLHLQVIRIAIERSLCNAGTDTEISTPIKLIELLYDLCLESGETVTAPKTRTYLESLGTKGKAGKLAQSLLSLPEGRAQQHRKAAAMQALQSRVDRAQRYKRILNV